MLITNNAHQKLTSAITLLFRPKVYRVLSDLEQANSKIISYKKENQFIHSVHDKLILITMRRDRDSNPGYLAVQRFSRPPQSTTLPPLQDFFFQKYFLLKALQRYDFILNKQIVYQFFCYKIFKSYFCIRIINERNKS